MNCIRNASSSPQLIVISDDDDHEKKTMNKHGQQQHIPHTCKVCMKKFDTYQALISHHYQNLYHKMKGSSSSHGCCNQETQQGNSDSKPIIHFQLPPLDYLLMTLPKPTTCTMSETQPVTIRMKVDNIPESGNVTNVGLNGFKANVPIRPTVTMPRSQTQRSTVTMTPTVTMPRSQTPRPSVTMTWSETMPAVKKTRVERENIDLNVGYFEANVTPNHHGGIYQVKRAPNNQDIDLNLRL